MDHPTETKVQIVPSPDMANFNGKVHGGELLKLLDQVASATGRRYARNYVVTAKILEVNYYAPIEIGDYVTVTGWVRKVGKTSMTIDIDVHAESPYTGKSIWTNNATFVMVSMGSDGRPTPVKQLES